MKQILLSAVACLIAISGSSQLIEIVSEVYAEHDGIEIPALEGMTTYRVYAVLTNELDEISAVYGDVSSPLSSTGFFSQISEHQQVGASIQPFLRFQQKLNLTHGLHSVYRTLLK